MVLYLSTMFCSGIYFNPVTITLRVILNVEMEKSEVDSLTFRNWSKCPDLQLSNNKEFSLSTESNSRETVNCLINQQAQIRRTYTLFSVVIETEQCMSVSTLVTKL